MTSKTPSILLLVHNIRSTHNVGALFRTAEGCSVARIILSGYSPYPTLSHDTRLPHIHEKLTRDIHKTALGAETLVPFEHLAEPPLSKLKQQNYRIVALEQAANSVRLSNYRGADKIALLIGEEINGIAPELLAKCDDIVEIPMQGEKESFNVSVAAGMALYELLLR